MPQPPPFERMIKELAKAGLVDENRNVTAKGTDWVLREIEFRNVNPYNKRPHDKQERSQVSCATETPDLRLGLVKRGRPPGSRSRKSKVVVDGSE